MPQAYSSPVSAPGSPHLAVVSNWSDWANLVPQLERSSRATGKSEARSCVSTLNEVLLVENLRHHSTGRFTDAYRSALNDELSEWEYVSRFMIYEAARSKPFKRPVVGARVQKQQKEKR